MRLVGARGERWGARQGGSRFGVKQTSGHLVHGPELAKQKPLSPNKQAGKVRLSRVLSCQQKKGGEGQHVGGKHGSEGQPSQANGLETTEGVIPKPDTTAFRIQCPTLRYCTCTTPKTDRETKPSRLRRPVLNAPRNNTWKKGGASQGRISRRAKKNSTTLVAVLPTRTCRRSS